MFSKFIKFAPIDLKIGTQIDWTYTMYLAQKFIDQNNVTYVSMATKYPIIRHRAFFKILTFLFPQIMKISVRNSYQTLMTIHKCYTKIERSKFKVMPSIH